ncbi:DNA-binding protein [Alicyclobacillus cellulosilyticus]|uniref:RNA-binding protein KhpB n=1 Tax=Alicyclobacillus cellulosilyticus TaxID=1003997 RepID=A0A917K322_9BACL|nr:RNA-binding cell elongation regulator Jag/EloR [Alicyclobacillus cellulosilyticus]GGI95045.1 DNA-binding protein [Alicyclobacillus cellulosilyticus]
MKRVVATGRTVDEAVTSALVRLGVTRSQAIVRVIQEPVRGFLGLFGGRKALVEVTVRLTPEEAAKSFLREVLRRMGWEVQIAAVPEEEDMARVVWLDVRCPEAALPSIIGRHGATLDALQYLVNVVVHREAGLRASETDDAPSGRAVRFVVDAGGYRRRRRDALQRMAEQAAARAVASGRPVGLAAMPAADRKVIHAHLQRRSDVTTVSEGEEPHRRVIVIPVVDAHAEDALQIE